MADDCVCTNLFSIYSVLNDIASSLKYSNSGIASINANQMRNLSNQIVALTSSIGTLNDVVNKLDEVFKCNSVGIGCILSNALYNAGVSNLQAINNQLNFLNAKFVYDNKNIAEIWSYKEMCVSNETIVESPLSTYVSKGSLEFNDV